MKKFYEEPKMSIASLTSEESIAVRNIESIVEYKDTEETTTKPVPVFGGK